MNGDRRIVTLEPVLHGLRTRRYPLLTCCFLLVLAFALRLHHLDHVDLRGDEAFDILYAAQSLSEVVRNDLCCQAYPPLNHGALHYWLPLAGRSEFAYRFLFGVVPGLLVVVLVYKLAGELYSAPAAPTAALLAAANPFLVWWSQDGHFYSGLTAASAAILWLGLRALRRECTWRSLLPYGTAAALGLYFHYFAAFAVLGVLSAAGLRALREGRVTPWVRRLLLAHTVVAAVFAPWALAALGLMQRFQLGWAPAVSLPALLGRLAHSYSLGYTAPTAAAAWILIPFATALAVGLMCRPRWDSRLTAPLLLFGPLFVFWLASLLRPMFDDKFTVFALTVYLAVLGGGLACTRLGRTWRLALLALMLSASGASLLCYYHDSTAYKSPDWSAAADTITRLGEPGDAVIYDFPDPAVLYYAGLSERPVYLVPDQAEADPSRAEAQIEALAGEHDRLWLVPLARPEWPGGEAVERLLERHCLLEAEQAYRGVELRLYRTPRALAGAWRGVDAEFVGGPRLAGYLVEAPTMTGSELRVVLRWESAGPTDGPYTVFVHLVDPDGAIVAQRDNVPVSGTYPTTEWRPDEEVVDGYALQVPAEVDLGSCRLRVGLYRPDTMIRLPVTGEDAHEDYAELPLVAE